jgi:predicted dehydrogenase
MSIKLAFMGFRHGHIFDVYARATEDPEFSIVAACEEHEPTRKQLLEGGQIEVTHSDYREMLDEIECDVIAVGDYFGRRGAIIIEALRRGKHVISDKPLCITLEELDEIESLAREKNLVIGCQLDLRDNPQFIGLHQAVVERRVGEVQAIVIGGQHPLMLDSRAGWYFEEGKHGGTINDIGIHAFDGIEWITGHKIAEITAARSWNAFAEPFPHFHDAGQFMLTLQNGCGVLGDVSYFSPDKKGYSLEFYWRMTVFGRNGILETSVNTPHIIFAEDAKCNTEKLLLPAGDPGGYFRAFKAEIDGLPLAGALNTNTVLRACRTALLVQQAAYQNKGHVPL